MSHRMSRTSIAALVALSMAGTVGASGHDDAAARSATLTFDAVAVNPGGIYSRAGLTPVIIRINRWSTEAESNQLRDALVEKSDGALLETLRHLKPEAGSLSTTTSLPWTLRYAHETPLASGGRRIVFVTDRPMSFSERTGVGRARDYEYMLGEFRVGADGKGEGKLVTRANVTYDRDTRTVTIENYDSQPVRLTNVAVRNP
jgi:hypothetical protein